MSRPKRGDEFTHHKYLDPSWKPNRDQTWSQAPKARMRVTDVRRGTVFYTYADGHRGEWKMPQAEFLVEYGDELRPNLTVIDGERDRKDYRRGEGYEDLIRRVTASVEKHADSR